MSGKEQQSQQGLETLASLAVAGAHRQRHSTMTPQASPAMAPGSSPQGPVSNGRETLRSLAPLSAGPSAPPDGGSAVAASFLSAALAQQQQQQQHHQQQVGFPFQLPVSGVPMSNVVGAAQLAAAFQQQHHAQQQHAQQQQQQQQQQSFQAAVGDELNRFVRAAQAAKLNQQIEHIQHQAQLQHLFATASAASGTNVPSQLTNSAPATIPNVAGTVTTNNSSQVSTIVNHAVGANTSSDQGLHSVADTSSSGSEAKAPAAEPIAIPPPIAKKPLKRRKPKASAIAQVESNASAIKRTTSLDTEKSASSSTTAKDTKPTLKPRTHDEDMPHDPDAREVKRIANRKSAQLSRKRKKEYLNDLYEELELLRGKERILLSIPDLIVAFDAAGRFKFISPNVASLLLFNHTDLEERSFWTLVSEDSARMLKGAFMDALASRQQGGEASPLGDGTLDVTMYNGKGEKKLVTLNGSVQFSGSAPECVCSIRVKDTVVPFPSYPSTELNSPGALVRQGPAKISESEHFR